jgi:hypothetical protein
VNDAELDWPNIAEKIEAVGSSGRRTCGSHLAEALLRALLYAITLHKRVMQSGLLALEIGYLTFDTATARWHTDKEYHKRVVVCAPILIGANPSECGIDKALFFRDLRT